MSTIPSNLARVSNLLQSSFATQTLDNTQTKLLKIENQLATGQRVNVPSDDPIAASAIIQLKQSINVSNVYSSNITVASGQLGEADSTLGDLTSLLQQAQSIASQNVGSDVTAAQRSNSAAVVQSLFNQALSIGNKTFQGLYLFGGDGGQTAPFVQTEAGVQDVVSGKTLSNSYDVGLSFSFQVSGSDVFAGTQGQLSGADLGPVPLAGTRLSDVRGAAGTDIYPGTIQISNGTVTRNVDLSTAASLGDIVNAINQAGVGGITASISGQGITLAGSGSDNISVVDAGGTTASDLGIATPAGGAGVGVPVTGAALNTQITMLTPISSLRGGLGLDNSGLVIGNGTKAATITWPTGGDVQDILNAINGANLGVSAQINSTGTGINLLNTTQGAALTVGENSGQTASQLGLRSFSPSTRLSEINGGQGVKTAGGTTPDFRVDLGNGTSVSIALGSATTVQNVIDAINAAGAASGLTAGFSTTGNGIVLTDGSGGNGSFSVTPLNFSTAAASLGLTHASSGQTINGGDVNAVQSGGIFSNLQALITALQKNDVAGITAAGQGLQQDAQRVIAVNGKVGSLEQELSSRQTQMQTQTTATQSLLSQLQDTNMSDAISQFQTLQTSLQASLETVARSSNLSLLNFLS